MQDNIVQVMPFTLSYFSLKRRSVASIWFCIVTLNYFIANVAKKRKVVFCDYLVIKLVLVYQGEKQKYQVTKLVARAKLSGYFNVLFKVVL